MEISETARQIVRSHSRYSPSHSTFEYLDGEAVPAVIEDVAFFIDLFLRNSEERHDQLMPWNRDCTWGYGDTRK